MLFDTIFLISIGEIAAACLGALIVCFNKATTERFKALRIKTRDAIILAHLFLVLSGTHNLVALGIWGMFQ